ncbi:MAG TPA: hypothetical protein VMT10_14605 [Solirubrobacteraceae bacterium]|nr:hypothetical protein [Solirubrobacteraceae bacterium]
MAGRGAAIALLAWLALGAASARATDGVLAGRLVGIPPNARSVGVRVVDAADGSVIAVLRAQRSGAFRFPLAPGAYVAAGDARGARGDSLAALSAVVRVGGPGTARRIVLPLRTQPPPGASAAAAATSAIGSGTVITVQGVVLDAAPGARVPNLSLDGAVLGDVFDACSAAGVRFVDRSQRVVDLLDAEQELVNSGRVQGPYSYHPLAPQLQLSGQGTISADGRVTVVFDVVDLATHGIVSEHRAEGTLAGLDDVIAQAADDFVQRDCGVPPKGRCPLLAGARQACVTSIVETGYGSTVSQRITSPGGSCADPAGFSRSDATNLAWHSTWPGVAVLNATPGASPGAWWLSANYRVDAMCGLNNEHCSETILGSRSGDGALPGWAGTGRPGRWRLVIPTLASSYHPHCSASAIDDPVVRGAAALTVTLRGRPGHLRPRTKTVDLSLSRTLDCGVSCKDSYDLHGHVTISGLW